MTLLSPSRGQVILHTHIGQFVNLIGGVANAGEDVRFTQRTNASDYANIFGNVDTTNGYAAKFQYGPALTPTTLMTVSKATGVAITQSNASVYALSVTQQNSANLIQKWTDSTGANPFIMTNTGLFSSSLAANGPGIAIGNGVTGRRMVIQTTLTQAALTAMSLPSFKEVEFIMDAEAGVDNSVISAFMRQTATGASSGGRAAEFQAIRNAAGTQNGGWATIECGIHSLLTDNTATSVDNVGLYIHTNTNTTLGNAGAGVPADCGIFINASYDGFWDYLRIWQKNALGAATTIMRIAGGIQAGDQDGDIITARRIRTGNGTNSLPSHTFDSDLDTGMFLNAANTLAFATGGTQRVYFTSAGSVVVGTAILTNATDGFLYIPTCGGAPSGTPTAQTGVPLIFDATNNKLMVYDSGWIGVTLS